MQGATLSACFTPEATFSPNMAKRTKVIFGKRVAQQVVGAHYRTGCTGGAGTQAAAGFYVFMNQ
jgi:hypothetical protein